MIDNPRKQAILCLHQQGKSAREISRLLAVSRNTVKKIVQEDKEPKATTPLSHLDEKEELIKATFKSAQGNVVRVKEIIKQEHKIEIPYSTLTQYVRAYDLRQKKRIKGHYHFEPGEEMQHDTSPHKVMIGGTLKTAQCAALIFSYSRLLYVQYYPRFTRFEAKIFLRAALVAMQGACGRCVIDNTNVVLAAGSGADAVIASEMQAFSRMFNFEFYAHAVGDPNRKGRIERPFYYVETNFLTGRRFQSWDDLNAQALNWCENVANAKEKRILGMSPKAAFVMEKNRLIPLPKDIPLIYEHYQRIIDSQGYINFESNRYSAPENLIGTLVDVYKYSDCIEIFYRNVCLGSHERALDQRNARITNKAHHPSIYRRAHRKLACEEERLLLGHDETLDVYLSQIKKHVRGRGVRQFKRLLDLKRTYPSLAFMRAIEQAQLYGLYDMNRLEELVIKFVSGDYFNL